MHDNRYSSEKINSIFENAATVDMNLGDFDGIWTRCPNCNHSYENDLLLATSAGYPKYIKEKNVGDPRLKAFLLAESHMTLLQGLKGADHLDDSYVEEGRQLANKILKKFLPKIKNSPLVPQQRQLEFEADLHRLGLSYYAEDSGGYEAAIEYEKRARELFEILASGAIPLMYDQDYEGELYFDVS